MTLIVNLIVLGILLIVVIVLWIYRHMLENREDHYIHLRADEHDSKVLQSQSAVGKRVETIGRTKNILLIVVIVYGVVLAAFEIYRAWINNGS